MFNVNGWICIQENLKDDDDKTQESTLTQIQNKLDTEFNFTNELYEIKKLNYSVFLNISIAHNHRSEHSFELLEWIGKIAVRSYGLIYIQDDEDLEDGNDNKFKVLRMRRGKIDLLDDPFLSPIVPLIED